MSPPIASEAALALEEHRAKVIGESTASSSEVSISAVRVVRFGEPTFARNNGDVEATVNILVGRRIAGEGIGWEEVTPYVFTIDQEYYDDRAG